MDKRKENFEENKYFGKIYLWESLFPPLVKTKNQHQNFEKHPNKKDATKMLQFFVIFEKKRNF